MKEDLRNLHVMSSARNYNRWIFDTIKSYTGKRVLEIGCGIGTMTEYFIDREIIVGIDVSGECHKAINNRFAGRPNFKAMVYDICDKRICVELKDQKFDTIICINVLEHIQDDLTALRNMYELLDKGGKMILVVPAFNRLYGTIDKSDLHRRRYNRTDLKSKLEKCAFRVSKWFYMNLAGIFVWILHGKILKKSIHPKGQVSLFDKFVFLASFLEKVIKPPVGLSLVFICEKE